MKKTIIRVQVILTIGLLSPDQWALPSFGVASASGVISISGSAVIQVDKSAEQGQPSK